jgi:uncharacterized membrane protein YoaK (UPF0700 family)
MLALTFGTGIIDAVGYLGLDRVFTGNMTGNVVILGMALVGGDHLPVLGPVLALTGFMAGAALGGRVLVKALPGWTHRTTALLSIVALTMSALATTMFLVDEVEHWLALSVTTLLGAAMGVQAATARFIGVKDVTTVVVTSTITGLAADSVLGAGKRGGSGRRVAAVLLILLGAASGALLLKADVAWGLAVSGALVAGVTLVGALHAQHHPRI